MLATIESWQRAARRLSGRRSPLVVGLLLALLLVAFGTSTASSSTIPTISIVSVVADQSVTIRTHNYPANQDFAVTMGAMGSRGIDGYLVATTNSGGGGSFTATYNVPEPLKGSHQIAIRLQSRRGYYSYNWFYNNTTSGTPGSGGTGGATPGYTGIPTFKACKVAKDASVTIVTNNFPANQTFTVTMGPMFTRGIGGTQVGTIESGSGGTLTATFNIPEGLRGANRLSIRAQTAHSNPYHAFNWFWNKTADVCN